MELKPGYKQTEVGMIPEDWEIKSLGDVAHIKTGSRNNEDKVVDGEYPFFVRSEFVERINSFSHDCEAILVPGEGKIGEIFHYLNGRFDVHQRVYAITKFASDVSGRFVHLYMKANFGAWAMQNTVKATVDSLRLPTFQNFRISLPPLQEQSTIATALGDVDALLSAQDALIAKKRAIKQGAMHELLTGKRRLPGFVGEWEVSRLDQLADIRSGGTPSTTRPEFWGDDIPWVTPTDITALDGHKYLRDTTRKITALGLKASSAEIIPANSIVMTTRATIGECAINAVPLSTNQGFKNFVPYESVDFEFLYYLLTIQKQGFIGLCAGSTFLEIGKTQLAGYEVRIPDKEEQAAIARALSDMDAEIIALEVKRQKTSQLKQGMMQELLTGRTRLLEPVVRRTKSSANVIAFQAKKDNSKNGAIAAKSPGDKQANVHFKRSVFAAEIVDQLHNEPTFGHVKFEKLIFLAEHLCKVDTGSNYHRDAAGPYDNRALRSIDSQLKKQKWFDPQKNGGRYQYVPLGKHGGHKEYFDRYYADIRTRLDEIIATFRTAKTDQCEIVATLYGAWADLINASASVNDEAILDQVLNHWHDKKRNISEERWRKALEWMREKDYVPEGASRA